jgi:signal transduction histidine kinase/HPt (histidine-containing phosphotransfer) domain-containing protein
MNGIEVLSRLQMSEKTKDIPVIFITGVNGGCNESEGLAIGAVDYIRKPFDAMVVKLRVRHQIQIVNLQKDLEATAKASEMASQTKSAFLAHMSHEIRTPMNAILGVTEILIEQETLSAELEEGLDRIYSSCDLLLGIINDILDFSKIEAGKLEIMPTQYKVASLINDSVHLNMMRLDNKPIEFELKIKENIPAKLIGDELRIKQILNNLLSNAFKYTDFGKVILTVEYELPSEPSTGQITLVLGVQDTGLGMTKDQLSRLFEEYSRFHQKTGKTIEGTGLGLAISKRLINIMGGDLHVESELGSGSYFVVRLPQKIVDDEVLSKEVLDNLRQFRLNYMARRKRGQIVRDPMPYGSILIVDDVETNIYVAVGLMKLYRLHIDTAMSGQEAIDKIKSGKVYDIVFMDHMMPDMDGMETTKHLRDLGYNAPIVALTANAVAGQAEIFLQYGFDEFISKPIDVRQLNSTLNKLIRDKQPPEVIEAARKQKDKGIELNVNNGICPQIDLLLLESFIRDANKAIIWLEEKFQNNGLKNEEDLRKFIVFVHGMKSSLWSIGEQELSELALKLEKSGRELSANIQTPGPESEVSRTQNIDLITTTTPEFLSRLHILLEKLETKRNEDGSADDYSNENIEDLHNKLLLVQEMCSDYNRKGALDILAEIKTCKKETKIILDKIMEHVLHSEFEEAENEVAAYIKIVSASDPSHLKKSLLKRKIDRLDINKGLERYEGDEQTYLKVLRSYMASVRNLLGEIENVNEDTLPNYKIKVHGIKGTSFDVFAEEIGKKASDLEKASGSGDINYVKEHNPEFLEITWKLVYDLEGMFFSMDAENPKPKKDKPDNKVLLKLLEACKAYDMDGADAAMAEIGKYQYESDDNLVNWLQENIDTMNFKQITEKLGELNL